MSSMFALSRGYAHWQAAQEWGQHPIKTWKESFGNKSWFAFTRVPIIYVRWNGSEMWVHFCPHSPFLPPPPQIKLVTFSLSLNFIVIL